MGSSRLTYDLEEDTADDLLVEFVTLLKSRPFYKLLTKLTGIELVRLENDESSLKDNEEKESSSTVLISQNNKSDLSSCVTNVRRWQHGCYTLVSDFDPCGKEFALDLMLSLACDGLHFFTIKNFFFSFSFVKSKK